MHKLPLGTQAVIFNFMNNTKEQPKQETKSVAPKVPDKFYFERDGKKEEVAFVRWIWAAIYKDDSELKQYDMDGNFHQFKEIKTDELKIFVMLNVATGKRFDIMVTDDIQIFHFYRTCGTIDGKGKRDNKIFVFGYQNKKTKQAAYHYILPNDTLLITNKDTSLEDFGVFPT